MTADDNTPNPETISIHALRKESDGLEGIDVCFIDISIHALRKESDPSQQA